MSRARLGVPLLLVGVLAATVAPACGADDRDLRAPSASQTTTSAPATGPSDAVGTNTEVALQLTSTAFAAGGVIPDRYTCRGEDVSPPLQWTNLPAGVTELALVMTDPDANGFVHWIVTDIPPTAGEFGEDMIPEGAVAGPNEFGRTGWAGPCPPGGTHTYQFRLLALSDPPELTPNLAPQAAVEEISALPALTVATLTATVAA